ncbi:hypothetical protein DFJ58DRAFT_743459 [Suillus subalutaceus]|uniref:uncharacterized protein n=1 Tax=Suillus subalutaceus TaxID=48586 RepID=UPI001B85DD85|nr:uncharacterized protein DFJ58DRAFT_743459 [Suillus subalutaceus]KAG1864640.1 hypothetical protein DFJ58DRAFT_743459 [Suillus subalutaceus]
MFPSKWYIPVILACLLQVSLALPLVARDPETDVAPVTDQFGGTGGSSGADW